MMVPRVRYVWLATGLLIVVGACYLLGDVLSDRHLQQLRPNAIIRQHRPQATTMYPQNLRDRVATGKDGSKHSKKVLGISRQEQPNNYKRLVEAIFKERKTEVRHESTTLEMSSTPTQKNTSTTEAPGSTDQPEADYSSEDGYQANEKGVDSRLAGVRSVGVPPAKPTPIPQPPSPLTLKELQIRHDLLAKSCRSTLPDHESLEKFVLKHIHVDSAHKALYCLIPKAGSTNWLRMLFNISTQGTQPGVVSGHVHGIGIRHKQGLTSLNEYNTRQREAILREYRKVIIVRNPFTRWLSAFRQKFRLKSYRKTGRKIIKQYRPNTSKSSLEKGNDVKFSEFVKYLIGLGEENTNYNQHWAPYSFLCDPCNIDYDYIAKVETLDEDVKALRRIIFDNSPLAVMPKPYVNATKSEITRAFYAEIPAEDIRKLITLFAEDFTMFGYKMTVDDLE